MGMLMRRHYNGEQAQAPVSNDQVRVDETLESKTVADLRIIAQQRGLTGVSSLTKAELLDLLK